jgi:hypothetical protein
MLLAKQFGDDDDSW